MNSVGNELAPRRPGDPSAKPRRTRGWSSTRLGRLPKNWNTAQIPRISRTGTHSHQCRVYRGSAWCFSRWKTQGSAKRDEGGRQQQHRYRVTAACQTGAQSAPGPTGERQEHVDAIISFAGAGQGRRLFRSLDILTIE